MTVGPQDHGGVLLPERKVRGELIHMLRMSNDNCLDLLRGKSVQETLLADPRGGGI